jgi:hypothetical protein
LVSAQSAINALHNQRSLPPLRNPLQVRFADSSITSADRGQTNTENKLFVGGVPHSCGDKELRALFNMYGEVLDVYILASKSSQEGQRGCAFIRYTSPNSCAMAIEILHGKYAMQAGELPLVVRYADPPKSQRGGTTAAGGYGLGGRGSFPTGWPASAPTWPSSPPIGWPMHPFAMPGGGMPGYSPWLMPPAVGQPAIPYGFYGQHYGAQQGGPPAPAPQSASCMPPSHQFTNAPPPPLSNVGVSHHAASHPPPLPPMMPPASFGVWTEHLTPEGLRYYYNTQTGTSSWEMPLEMQMKHQRQLSQQQSQHQQIPPLPQSGGVQAQAQQGVGLDKAMEALSIGINGSAYAVPSSTAMSAAGGYLPLSANDLGSIGSIATLSAIGEIPHNGGPDTVPGDHAGVAPGGGEQQWWGAEQQSVNVQ